MILCLVRRPLDCGGVSGAIQIGNLQFTIYDLCYSKYDDTKTRNEVCDKTMLVELNGIVNPTLRVRIDK